MKLCIFGLFVLFLGGGAGIVLFCPGSRETQEPRPVIVTPAPAMKTGRTVKVRLRASETELQIGSSEGGLWREEPSHTWEKQVAGGEVHVQVSDLLVQVDGEIAPTSKVRFVPEDSVFQLGDRHYRGELIIETSGEYLKATEEVALEDYIRAVVPSEMGRHWPLQALMAQAVASRTFALYRTEFQGRPYLRSSDMAYRGLNAESPRTDMSVEMTGGTVLKWEGRLPPSYYHSTCGGCTSSVKDVFGEPEIPPLQGVACGTCENSPHYHWQATLLRSDIIAALSSRGVAQVKQIRADGADRCGRVENVIINQSRKLPAETFRSAVGVNTIKSTIFDIQSGKNDISFTGRGWGHGVGLCQWGARGLAENGKSCEDILLHYYPGASLTPVENP